MSIRSKSFVPVLLLAAVSFSRYRVTCSLTSTTRTNNRIIVVGKIIIDEYGGPGVQNRKVSVGGGGPQAAFGAAAALAFLSGAGSSDETPAPQPVVFFGPVGDLDWSNREEEILKETLKGAVQSIHLIRGESLRTPRIRLWHDEQQNVLWKPMNDSFGSKGADQLWRNRPSADDLLHSLRPDDAMVAMHVVLEGGRDSPGLGEDSTFLLDSRLRKRVGFLGVEPVVFQDEATSRVKADDVASCCERLSRTPNLDCVSPDMPLYREANAAGCWEGISVAVRNGPSGSVLLGKDSTSQTIIPAASLITDDINPTGAGNAYSAAFTTCLSVGASEIESACIASAIGAVFCEYEHIPPWDSKVFVRLRQAVADVTQKMTTVAP